MKKNNKLVHHNILKENQDLLYSNWLEEIKKNPHYANEEFSKKEGLDGQAHDLLEKVISTLEDKEIPQFSVQTFQPVITLWHQLLKQHHSSGFSSKDTAMLIFSLKSSVLNYLKDYYKKGDFQYDVHVDQFRSLLDFLGLLTFEIYSAEKERLISHQSDQIDYLQSSQSRRVFSSLIGESRAMAAVYKAIGIVLENDITVLLQGETGTGKDVIATTIHSHSTRKSKPFIALNCGAIPKDLIESELFGHEKGSFTGADQRRLGKFELAEGGTLFLDEIGELPLDVQVKLLRVLQNREINRVGGTDNVSLNVRIIAATNRDLKGLVDEKKFRLDLYYRLHIFPISIPNLAQRQDDIIPLALHFIERYTKEFNIESTTFLTEDAKTYLLSRKWEGNIRELENMIQRSVLISAGKPISKGILSLEPGKIPDRALLESPQLYSEATDNIMPLSELEKAAIKHALKVTNGNIQKSAKSLGVSRGTFYNKLKKYQIDLD